MTQAPLFAQSPADLPTRDQLLAMSGLQFMQAMLAGEIPHPTIAALMGYNITSVEPGRVTLRGRPGFQHTNPFGGVHGGIDITLDEGTPLLAIASGKVIALGVTVTVALPSAGW